MRAALLGLLLAAQAPPALEGATVGMPVSVRELVLPGGELEAVPATDAAPLVVRVDAVRPHGEHLRYDLVWYALEPGSYDLGDYLRRKGAPEGTSARAELPPLPVTVRSLLAPGQVEPHAPREGRMPWIGGYRWVLGGAAAAWLLGALALLRAGRRARGHAARAVVRGPSLEERLAELVDAASSGSTTAEQRAELELALITAWQRRLGLQELEPAAALAVLRAHAVAGPLFAGLEDWLHRPGQRWIDVAALLAPHRALLAGGGAAPVEPA